MPLTNIQRVKTSDVLDNSLFGLEPIDKLCISYILHTVYLNVLKELKEDYPALYEPIEKELEEFKQLYEDHKKDRENFLRQATKKELDAQETPPQEEKDNL